MFADEGVANNLSGRMIDEDTLHDILQARRAKYIERINSSRDSRGLPPRSEEELSRLWDHAINSRMARFQEMQKNDPERFERQVRMLRGLNLSDSQESPSLGGEMRKPTIESDFADPEEVHSLVGRGKKYERLGTGNPMVDKYFRKGRPLPVDDSEEPVLSRPLTKPQVHRKPSEVSGDPGQVNLTPRGGGGGGMSFKDFRDKPVVVDPPSGQKPNFSNSGFANRGEINRRVGRKPRFA